MNTAVSQYQDDQQEEVARLKRLLAARPTEIALYAAQQNSAHWLAEFEAAERKWKATAQAYEAAASAWFKGRSASTLGVDPAWLAAHGYEVEGDTAAWGDYSAPLPLGAPVRVACLGIEGIISGRSTCSVDRFRVTWFDRRLWTVRSK